MIPFPNHSPAPDCHTKPLSTRPPRATTWTSSCLPSDGQLPAGHVQVPGQHHPAGGEDTHHRGPVRSAAGVRHAAPAAQVLPGAPVRGQAAQPAHARAPLRPQQVAAARAASGLRGVLVMVFFVRTNIHERMTWDLLASCSISLFMFLRDIMSFSGDVIMSFSRATRQSA